MHQLRWLLCLALVATSDARQFVASTLRDVTTIPSIDYAHSHDILPIALLETITVENKHADSVDLAGETLIPPTLYSYASTFAHDWEEVTDLKLELRNTSHIVPRSILLTIDTDPSRYIDAAGRPTAEGYSIIITSDGVQIKGASALGAWWGTRTLLQMVASHPTVLPTGCSVDSPGWRVRGLMLDGGRKFYPASFIVDMCAYLSFFKQNTLHLHLSDNLVVANSADKAYVQSLYSGFRLSSDDPRVARLANPPNESYTRAAFDGMQYQCAARGVTIVPEIESPGHALPLVRWREEMALETDYTMLNISAPQTIPLLKQLWSVFLPWCHSKTIHIGADEYDSSLVPDYNDYVNAMSSFIGARGKGIRIWGTFPPRDSYFNNIGTNVSIQHWEKFEDDPLRDYLDKGYSVLNSDDAFYVVNKYSSGYSTKLNRTAVFHGSPDGSAFAPNIFDTRNSSNNPPRNEPNLLGHVTAVWNDNGFNGSVISEMYYAIRDSLPALADKQWGGSLKEADYERAFETLHRAIPGQNLDMAIPSKTDIVFSYYMHTLEDSSGNGYNLSNYGCNIESSRAIFDGLCHLATPLSNLGRNYTLSLQIKPYATGGALLANHDSALLAGPNLTFFAEGSYYPLNYSLHLDQWTKLEIIGHGESTAISVNGGDLMPFLAEIGVAGTEMVWRPMAFPAPIAEIGRGFRGEMRRLLLRRDP